MRTFFLATAALLVMSGCASTGTGEAAPGATGSPTGGAALLGAEWAVFEIAGTPIVANSKPTITFEEGRVFGAASCNRFMGGYTVGADGLALQMSQMASTMMACPESLMVQEGKYLGLLGTVTGYAVEGNVLTLKAADGTTIKARR